MARFVSPKQSAMSPFLSPFSCQMAAVLVLGPIFEADLEPEQYAYRPERSAKEAVRQVTSSMMRTTS
jgi:retron-type reverse transcriptase